MLHDLLADFAKPAPHGGRAGWQFEPKYDGLHYVGRAPVPSDGAEVWELLEPLMGGAGFTGRAAGGKSRWSGKERRPVPLEPVLVAEVSADHITGDHMRHGARLLRWRTDKALESCILDQIRG